jgi:SPOR domain
VARVTKIIPWARKTLCPLTISLAVIVSGGASFAQSEIDAYDRAVSSQTKEAALAFLNEFGSSHLVGDLIDSLRPEVARQVCADLPGGVSGARRACEQLPTAPVAEAKPASKEMQPSALAAPTQPIETQPIGGMPPAPATTSPPAAAPQSAPLPAESQGESIESTAPAVDPGTVAARSTPSLPEPAATGLPTPISSRPTVYVRPDAPANIQARATEASPVIGTAASNGTLTLLARDRNWLEVIVPGTAGQLGWVHASRLQTDAHGIVVGPATGTTASTVTAGASTAKAPATQVATGTVPEMTTDEEMMSSGIGEMPMPAAGTHRALPAAPTQTAGYRIQLLSTKSPTDTQDGWMQLQAAYPDLLAGLQLEVVDVDLGAAKGAWYRGLAGPIGNRDEANMLCTVMRSRPPHNDCFVVGH